MSKTASTHLSKQEFTKEYREILQQISDLEGKIRGDKSGAAVVFLAFILMPLLLITLFFMRFLPLPMPIQLVTWLFLGGGVILMLGVSVNLGKREEKLKYFEQLRDNYLIAQQKVPVTPYDSLLQMNINNLQEQYQQTKGLAAKGIYLSVLLSLGGMGIIVGTLSLWAGSLILPLVAYVGLGMSVVLLVLAAWAFANYNKTVRHIRDYYDNLVNLQNMLVALKLTESAQDERARILMEEKVMDYLMDKINWY